MKKKLFAVLLTVIMVISLLPAQAFAADENAETFRYCKDLGSVKVTISDPDGVLPEGTDAVVRALSGDELEAARNTIENDLGRKVGNIQAVDIKFYCGAEQIEPAGDISVVLESDLIKKAADPVIVHIHDEKGAPEIRTVKATKNAGKMTFKSGRFSVYAVVDTPVDTYNFYVDGALVRTQVVAAGDYLYAPDTPADSDGDKFTGWYIEGASDPIEFSGNGTYTVESVTGGATITVNAQFGDYVYLTFRDQDGNVFSRIGVPKGGTYSLSNLPSYTPKLATQNLAGWSTTEGKTELGTGDVAVDGTITANASTTYYPIIQTGHWIHFDANRSHVTGMETVNVSYTPPIFVRQGQAASSAPANPTAEIAAYTFEGWYTDPECTNRFTFGSTAVITENITLYANWNVGQAQFSVVIWQQQVTDNKTATGNNRHWDYYTSYTGHAAIGTTVTYGSTLRYSGSTVTIGNSGSRLDQLTYTGFTRDSYDSSITVAADGSATLNVYYRRNLMTIEFYVYRNNNTWNFSENAINNQGQFRTSAQVWRTLTGLYGQTFAQAAVGDTNAGNYVWPADYRWYTPDDGAYYQSILTAFTTNVTPLRFGCMGSNGSNTVYHVKQNADGTWPTQAQVQAQNSQYADQAKLNGWGSGFTVQDKFSNYHAVAYSMATYYQNTTGRTNTSAGTSISGGNNDWPLYIYHARNEYTIEFYNGTEKVDSATKLYEAPLSEYSSKTLEPTDDARYSFGGWSFTPDEHDANNAIDWTDLTMPAQTLRVYAIWVSIAYNVKLDLGYDSDGNALIDATPYHSQPGDSNYVEEADRTGSHVVMSTEQSRNFWPTYGATIDDNYMSAATRKGYALVGWYMADGTAWDFGNAVSKDLCDQGPFYDEEYKNNYYVLNLTAKWRLDANIYVDYVLGTGGEGTFEDDEKYVQFGSVGVLPGEPTNTNPKLKFAGWVDLLGNLHQPGDTFVIDSEKLLITGDDGKLYVLLTALWTGGVPMSTITYRANYEGSTAADVVDDNNGDNYQWNDVATLKGSDTFTRTGYTIIGWNTDAEKAASGIVQFEQGSDVYVSAMNTDIDEDTLVGNNDLYAVWATTVEITVTGSHVEETYTGSQITNSDYTVTAKVAGEIVALTALPSGITLTINGTAVSGGTLPTVSATGTNVGEYSTTLTVVGSSTATVNSDGTYTAAYVVVINGTTATLSDGKLTASDDSEAVELKINPATLNITVNGSSTEEVYNGSEQTYEGTVTATSSDTGFDASKFSYSGSKTVKGTDAGVYTTTLVEASCSYSDTNYTVTWTMGDPVKLTITPAPLTITVNGSSTEKVYNGSEQTYEGTVTPTSSGTGFDAGKFSYSGSKTAKGTNVGDYTTALVEASCSYDDTNYTVTWVIGDPIKLTITPAPLTITVNGSSTEKVYNGSEQTYEGTVTATSSDTGFDASKFSYSGSKTAKGTNVGDYTTALAAASCSYSDTNYTVTWTIGDPVKLTITKAKLTITAEDKEKRYDKDPSTDPELTAKVEGAAEGDTINYTLSREEGQDVGEYKITVTAGENPNYDVTVVPGTFTILPEDSVIYKFTEGDGQVWDKRSDADAKFTVVRDPFDEDAFKHFTGIQIDGKDVDKANYDAESGSVKLTLHNDYLKTLAYGDHSITAVFNDGKAEATFAVDAVYTVTGPDLEGETVVTKYHAGETVTLPEKTKAPEGKEFDGWTATDSEGNEVKIDKNNQFTMPEADVVYNAKFKDSDVPYTGDDSEARLYFCMLCISVAGLLMLADSKKGRKKEH